MGKELHNVQVEVEVRGQGEFVFLRDIEGVFLEVGPHVVELRQDRSAFESSKEQVMERETADDGKSLCTALAEAQSQNEALADEAKRLREELMRENEWVKEMWKMNCAQLSGFDEALSAKDAEIEALKERVSRRETFVELSSVVPPSPTSEDHITVPVWTPEAHKRRGKAPLVSEFTGEDPEYLLDDWLPSLERASLWNAWTEEEKLMRFAGHLRGRALQEWNLLSDGKKATLGATVKSLGSRIDDGCKVVAAQHFRHLQQKDSEAVSDLIRHLERTFPVAYGQNSLSAETRDALLYAQLQEALRYELMRALAISRSMKYQKLCGAAKNEEKRLAELRKRQQYSRSASQAEKPKTSCDTQKNSRSDRSTPTSKPASTTSTEKSYESRKCHYCKKICQ